VGGAGRVGLPLALSFAATNQRVIIYDLNDQVLAQIGSGQMPFLELGGQEILERVLGKTLFLSSDISDVAKAEYVIVAIGTPVDEYLNPNLRVFLELFGRLRPHLNNRQTVIIRSTVFPRTCAKLLSVLGEEDGPWKIAYCPERISQGHAIEELKQLPQIVSGLTPEALASAERLFSRISPKVIPLAIEEAELAKLFSNAWRYLQFAAANQFYMMSEEFGVDFGRIRQAMVDGYGRAASLPIAGFAAGPCLLKDTMQLAAFNNNNFMLGHAAMLVNEGLPAFLVRLVAEKHDLGRTTVGILGMAFKADIDDIRDSLSYKLGKILRFQGARVLYSDEYVEDPTFSTKEDLIAGADVVIVGAPHSAYRDLEIPEGVDVIDTWGILKQRGERTALAAG
jgi:UDP-N-acetyl-D-mannosaminuronic acid dehydrogenase